METHTVPGLRKNKAQDGHIWFCSQDSLVCLVAQSFSPIHPSSFFSKPRSNSISSKRALQIPSLKLELVTLSSLLTQHSVLAFILVYCLICLSTYLLFIHINSTRAVALGKEGQCFPFLTPHTQYGWALLIGYAPYHPTDHCRN